MTVLKVSKVSNPHSVAGAIAGLVRDHDLAVMQAIGAAATNQAVKAIAIARSFMREEGIDLLARVTFLDVEFGGETRTALRFEIAHRAVFPEHETPVEPSAAIGTPPNSKPSGSGDGPPAASPDGTGNSKTPDAAPIAEPAEPGPT